jgi:hypothetical protein
MKVQAPFGFVTGCHAGDKFMVQATLASMRHYCPDVPICLTVDGEFDVSDLEKEYDLIVLRISDLPSVEMKKLIGGNYRAKLAAMWEGPFEYFVWLDSDAIVWGDFTSQIRGDVCFQIFWNEISIPLDAEKIPPWLSHFYFDVEKLRQFDKGFQWRGLPYFCSGTFACHRNVIPFRRWAEAEAWGGQVPGLFAWGEMGLLNYLVHSLVQRGELKISMTDLQHIPEHHGKEELKKDCANSGWHFPKIINRPRAAHFCGRKPFLFDRKAYSRPFTIARLEHYRRQHGSSRAWLNILCEDGRVLAAKLHKRFSKVKGFS